MKNIEELLNGTLGCLYLVGVFSVILYGCTCGQVLYYVTHYYIPGDHAYITILVALLWVLDTGKTMVDIACGWDVILLNHGDAFSLLDKIPAILPGEFAASHDFYRSMLLFAYNLEIHQAIEPTPILAFIHASSGSFGIWIIRCVTFSVMRGQDLSSPVVSGIIATIQVQTAGSIFAALPNSRIAGSFRPACSAVVDIYITVWLCYHLQDGRTGHPQSDYMITKLVNYAITRGIVTSVVQVIGFVLFLIDYHNETLWFMLCYIPASTIYVNSLLAMWNARHHVMISGHSQMQPAPLSTWRINSQVQVHSDSG
ncbi:hypothetical protein C8Q72DRAFT_844956 [Fomitopsis betulina]|nr:hypothetical protein C8Q72DRAFT_844956 [Fomitopsis betulina]